MALPKKLKNFNLFGDGNNWQGQIAEVVLPTLSRKVEEWSGGGMDGTVEIDLGQEKIEMEWTAGGLIAEIFDGYGPVDLDGAMLRFAGAYVRDDTDETVAVELVVRGRHREIEMGTAKNGEDNEIKVVTSCSYYKLSIDGDTIVEIDVPGYVFNVRGEDMLAAKRQALGL
ncbi:phage major tail tube protein [Alkalilimnicola ehrlichii]|uniref:Phage major tail tube protein n=1 Tax=Alkalilimnicola ehrlichii TaxID=351052 RepID=A0A3E0X1B7_9GAMM|nr:phage major tail tube protein [Alkalilimnicola ehrlichii]RFA31325.1 phage major tail tube protein [Alkalilimnicola ehrlichii]RFA39401.1 phage major tail tube protein [Alkalilimnicola ehrlichii]